MWSSSDFDLAPWEPTTEQPWDVRRITHLLRRAAFAPSRGEIERAARDGPQRTIDRLLAADDESLQEWGAHILPHGEVLDVAQDLRAQRASWLWTAVHTEQPLREKMTLFWHDHFAVGVRGITNARTIVRHVNLFRRFGLGGFRRLLREVTIDPTMLHFLDNYANGRPIDGQPMRNENYGRELLELFTMGADGGYSRQDVIETAKCLSGWGVPEPWTTNEVVYRPHWHIAGEKVVLGQRIQHADGRQDLESLLDVLLRWPATARYLVGKLWRWFVSMTPPPELLAALAERFRASGHDIRALLDVILRSRAFFSDRVVGALVKSPMELVVGSLRQLDRPAVRSYRDVAQRVTDMGLPLLDYHTPEGQAEGLAWLDTEAVIRRIDWADAIVRQGERAPIDWHPPPSIGAAGTVVDAWSEALLGDRLPDAMREQCIDVMEASPQRANGMRDLVRVLLASPQYQLN